MRILGIDPGADVGWAIVECGGKRPIFECGGSIDSREVFHVGNLFETMGFFDMVAIEAVSGIAAREGFGINMANGITHAAEVGGIVIGYATAKGVPWVKCRAREWRRALAGGNGNLPDATIKEALRLAVDGLPSRTNAHVRDACGVAIYAATRAKITIMANRAAEARGARLADGHEVEP